MMVRSKAGLLIAVRAAVVVALAAGCSAPRGNSEPARPLRVSGAEVALPFIRALCDAFAAANPAVTFEYLPPCSSLGGLQGVANGDLDIAAVSRLLKPEEEQFGLKVVWLATDPLILVTHTGTLVDSLTTRQVRDIYTGKVRNWKEVGGADRRIVVLDRPEQTSGKIIFRETILGPDLAVTPSAVVLPKAQDVHEAVGSTEGAICYTSLSLYRKERPDLAVLGLDGIQPEGPKAGGYPGIRPFGFVIGRKAPVRVKELVGFALSPAGRAVARDMCLSPAE